MKKFIFTAVIIVIVGVGLGFLTMAVYTRYKQKLNNTPAPVATISVTESNSRVEMVKKAAYSHYESMMVETQRLVAACNQGKQAYDRLSVSAKQQVQAPDCTAPEVYNSTTYFNY